MQAQVIDTTAAAVDPASMPEVQLRPGRVRPVWLGHPWVFADSLREPKLAGVEPGAFVGIRDPKGNDLGWGVYNPSSLLRVRRLSADRAEAAEPKRFLRDRLQAAIDRRVQLLRLDEHSNMYRLVNSDGDGLSGLVADQIGDVLVVQLSSLAMERFRTPLVAMLAELRQPQAIIERCDGAIRKLEGLPSRLPEALLGELPETTVEIEEHGLRYQVDLRRGQKTGFYADQRENRYFLRQFARGRRLVDAFAYTGAFALNLAGPGGAEHVVAVERSAGALHALKTNARLNGLDNVQAVHADAIAWLTGQADRGEFYDGVVLDPPRFASRRADVPNALRKYVAANAAALRAIAPEGGWLFTCTCSGAVPDLEFERMLAEAAQMAQRRVTLLAKCGQASDHPVPPTAPEGRYLRAYFCEVR